MQPAHPFLGTGLNWFTSCLLIPYLPATMQASVEKGKKRAGIKTLCHLALERDCSWVREPGSRQKVRNVAYSSKHWKPTTKQRYHLRNCTVTAEGQSYRMNNTGEGQVANEYNTLSCSGTYIHSLCQRALQQKRFCGFMHLVGKEIKQFIISSQGKICILETCFYMQLLWFRLSHFKLWHIKET